MKIKRDIPIPFLILILAGLVSLFSILATSLEASRSPAGTASNSAQIETVEQERMAALYFRILSWLSDLPPQAPEPARMPSRPSSTPQVVTNPHSMGPRSQIELCAFQYTPSSHATRSRARTR